MTSRYKEDVKELFGKLNKDFHEIVSNKQLLRTSTEKFLNNLLDELTLGIIFDIHRKAKTRAFDLEGEEVGVEVIKGVDIDVFSQYNIQKTQDCVCPYCDRAVAATRFASHLDKCMNKGKNRQKNAARKIPNNNCTKEQENSYKDSEVSDNEDDADWSPKDKKRKKKKDRNGKKRSRGTPKKLIDNEHMDTVTVDVVVDDQNMNNLRYLYQDHSNSSSPIDPTNNNCCGSSGSRKKEKSRSKKNRSNRSSPCSSTSSLD